MFWTSRRTLRRGGAAIQMHDKMMESDPQSPSRHAGAIDEERQLNASFFQRACAAALLIAIPVVTAVQAGAAEKEWRHGLSLFGDLKYKADFKHFDYVNPNAPKGGSVRQLAIGTFDNFNTVVAGAKGTVAAGVDLIYDTLMISALDEVSAEYGLLGRKRQPSRRFFLGHLSAAAAGEVSRRHAGDARRRDLLVQCIQTEQPATFRLLSARDEGRKDRRA